ncbi:type II toxin-antitoxin system HicA family toxin [Candidatus Bipolaricaulota bacterium]|nr:type II toxin-antitoxin system HicA family toxin [Candidatus Bipolaricaulota bacterium]
MVNLPSVSSAEVLRVLRKAGFIDAPHRGKGSHVALYHVDQHGRKNLVIVPKRKALPKGTLLAILNQAGLTRTEFIRLLKEQPLK